MRWLLVLAIALLAASCAAQFPGAQKTAPASPPRDESRRPPDAERPPSPPPTAEKPPPTAEKPPAPAGKEPQAPSTAPTPSPPPVEQTEIVVRESAGAATSEEEPSAPTAPPKEAPPAKAVEYDRILGAFTIDPEVFIYFTPSICAKRHPRTNDAYVFASMAARFAEAGARRGEAAARLNHGALLWLDGDGEEAYREIMQSQAAFAELGDVDGLAHAYEWLGYMFEESGELHRAAQHFSVAYGMYGLLENDPAQARVLAYAEE